MKLRTQLFFILLSSIVLYAVANFAVQQLVILPSYLELEQGDAQKDANRCIQAILREQEHLEALTHDWAAWDDTYEFIQTYNPAYTASNLKFETFLQNDINLMFFVDNMGQLVWGEIWDIEKKIPLSIKEFPKNDFPRDHKLLAHKDPSSIISGIFATNETPVLLASRPILTSDLKGPKKGSLIIGKFINKTLVQRLKQQTQLDFAIWPAGQNHTVGNDRAAFQGISPDQPMVFDKKDAHTLFVYTTYPDIQGNKALLIRIDLPRHIFQKGYQAGLSALISNLAAGVLILLISLLFIQILVTRPLSNLTGHVNHIRDTRELKPIKDMGRRDEIGDLANGFNNMITRLQDMYDRLEDLVDIRTQTLTRTNKRLKNEIQERKQSEQELMRAQEAAQAAGRAKNLFLANMSHEVRTPMNAVIGMTDLLLETPLTPEQKKLAHTTRKSSDLLLALVNNILDFSKLEAGELALEQIHFDLNRTIQGTMALFRDTCRQKGLSLDMKISPELPQMLISDPGRFKQILVILLNNAVKFTEEGGIFVSVELEPVQDRQPMIKFSVSDTGIGIDPVNQGRLFNYFSQADISATRKYGGSGIGLALAKQLTELMDGDIGVTCTRGMGSCFWFTLPAEKRPNSNAIPQNRQDKAGPSRADQPLTILLAEDNKVNQMLAVKLLKTRGHEVTVVENGKAAVDAVKTRKYHLILMDIQMPEMDGIKATRMIRKTEALNDRIPIIALTAHDMKKDRDECMAAGMDAYITKPIAPDLLFIAIQKTVAGRQPGKTNR